MYMWLCAMHSKFLCLCRLIVCLRALENHCARTLPLWLPRCLTPCGRQMQSLTSHLVRMFCVLTFVYIYAHVSSVFVAGRSSSLGGHNKRECGMNKLEVEGEWQVKAAVAGGWRQLRHHCLLDPENSF